MLWYFADERYGRGIVEKVIKQEACLCYNKHDESGAVFVMKRM